MLCFLSSGGLRLADLLVLFCPLAFALVWFPAEAEEELGGGGDGESKSNSIAGAEYGK